MALNPTSDFPKMPDWNPSVPQLLDGLRERTGGALHALDASRLATVLMGDAIAGGSGGPKLPLTQ